MPPLANVRARLVEGTVVAADYTMLDEVHLGAYGAGTMIVPAPEPGTSAMLVAGFSLVGTAIRRRAHAITRTGKKS